MQLIQFLLFIQFKLNLSINLIIKRKVYKLNPEMCENIQEIEPLENKTTL